MLSKSSDLQGRPKVSMWFHSIRTPSTTHHRQCDSLPSIAKEAFLGERTKLDSEGWLGARKWSWEEGTFQAQRIASVLVSLRNYQCSLLLSFSHRINFESLSLKATLHNLALAYFPTYLFPLISTLISYHSGVLDIDRYDKN